jgi:hypothetical protein
VIPKLKDLKTGEEEWSHFDCEADIFWWSEGNGSCDCNRALTFDSKIEEELEVKFGDYCYGCERFVVIDVKGDLEGLTKEEVIKLCNEGYDNDN